MNKKNILVSLLVGYIVSEWKSWKMESAAVAMGCMAAVLCLTVLIRMDEDFPEILKCLKMGIRRYRNHILIGCTLVSGIMWIICRIGICLSGQMAALFGIGYVICSLWIIVFSILNFDYIRGKLHVSRKDSN